MRRYCPVRKLLRLLKCAEIFPNVIVAADKRYPQASGQIPERYSKRKPGAAFEEIAAQFAKADPAMNVGMAEGAANLN